MINVYPSKLEGEPIEAHETRGTLSILEWLSAEIPSFCELEAHPLSVHVNGEFVPSSEWALTYFKPSDVVDIYPEPKAAVGAFIVAYGAYIALAVAVLAILLMPKPAIPKTNSGGQGDPLQEASAEGNKVKVNDVIREAAGTNKIFPDYLLPPHRYYESTRQQVVDLLLCVGVGHFEISGSQILIGDTPLVSLGDTASYQIYGPGESVAADPRAVWWHTSEEVGVSSTGSTGLELITTFGVEQTASASSYIFNEFLVTVPDGAGYFPIGWAEGMIVRIEVARNYTVTDSGPGVRDIITSVPNELQPFVGMVIEIVGDNAGTYIVNSVDSSNDITLNFTNGSPVESLTTGSVVMSIGYAGLRYRIAAIEATDDEDEHGAAEMTVERLTDTGALDATWDGFDYFTTGDAELTLDASTTEGDWKGPFAACPDGEVASNVELDIVFPAGLIAIDKKGRTNSRSVTVEWQWRNMATAGAWSSTTKTYTAASLDALGFTETIAIVGTYQPEVRMRRIGAKSTSAQVQETVQWASLKSRLQAPTSYADVTAVAFRIRGGDRLSTQTESQVSVKATRKLPVYSDGAWSVPVATRDIFPWVAYVTNSIGYGYDKLNIEEFSRLNAVWVPRGDYFDNLIESASTVKETINDALRVGFAELTVDRGTIRPARDELRTVWEQMYTPQNLTKPLERSFEAFSIDDPDGVDVEYRDSRSWQTETVQCRLPGDQGVRATKIKLVGVTDRTRAWRYGMRARRTQQYRRAGYKFSTEMDAFNSKYLSYVMLADAVPGYAQSGFLEGFSIDGGTTTLQTSELLEGNVGGVNTISLRRPDGSLSGPYNATKTDDYTVTISAPLDFEPVISSATLEPTHYLFGTGYPALVTSVSASGQFAAKVIAANYDPRVYADDDNFPPS